MSRGQGDSKPKEVFGPYLVYERLGVGGMATVHRAKKRGIEGFERSAALKRLLPHLAEDENFVKSFVREAKLAAMLQHANIVQLYELGRVGSTYFIAMQYVEGHDLRKLLRQAKNAAGPPTLGVALSLLGQLCDALDYAHARVDDSTREPLGIVHRDVSPSNLIVDHGGHLKVIDFGIAKASTGKLRTETGRVKGKLGYMSPEAVQGRTLDARSDIFSAGVIAHELLTARPLFASRNEYETLTRITLGDVKPPSKYNPDVPPELDEVVLRALAKKPEQRWPTAAAMRDALDRIAMLYKVPTTVRTVSEWLSWAFALEPDASRTTGRARAVSVWRQPSTPHELAAVPRGEGDLPVAERDDEIVEIAWGGRDDERAEGVPVVVDGVPDLSDEASAPAAPAYAARASAAERAVTETPPTVDVLPVVTFKTPTTPLPSPPPGGVAELRFDDDFGRNAPPPPMPASDTTKVVAIPPPPERPRSLATGTAPPPLAARKPVPQAHPLPRAHPVARRKRAPLARGSAMRPAQRPETSAPDAVADISISEPLDRPLKSLRRALVIGGALGLLGGAIAFYAVHGNPRATAGEAAAAEVARVTFDIAPPGATLAIDGREAPATELELASGSYAVTVHEPGYTPWSGELTVRAGEPQTVRVALDRAVPPEPPDWTDGGLIPASLVELDKGRVPRALRDRPLAALVCIDARGKVESVRTLLGGPGLTYALRKWRYEPYRNAAGTRVPVCFLERPLSR